MADMEEYFPRGGKNPVTKYFKQSANFLGKTDKTEKSKRKPKKKSEDDGYISDEFQAEYNNLTEKCAQGISYRTVKEGTLLLGRVRSVMETKVLISLPCRMNGVVMACHISTAYNKLLEQYVDDKIESIPELRDMFKPGQYVTVKVLEVEQSKNLMLSMMPESINSVLNHTSITKGTLLQGAVSSVEDHGFVIDLGIPNTRAFLPKSCSNEEITLGTGMLTWCVVKSITTSPDNSIVQLSNELPMLQKSVIKRSTYKSINHLLPGTAVEFVVDVALDNGIKGHIFEDTNAYIKRQHSDTVKGKRPQLGQKVKARILYEMPTSKIPFLTLRDIFETTSPDLDKERKYKDGDTVDNAQVIKIMGRCVLFKLGKRCFGTLNLKGIQVDENLSDEQIILKSYPLGSEHKVRILYYSLSDYMYAVSDQPEVLKEQYFLADELTPGLLVDATIKNITDSMLILQMGRMTGAVTNAHMTDAGICIDPKKATVRKLPKQKFKVGQPVKARVLFKNENGNIFLTMKPSLLSSDLEVVKEYQDFKVGRNYTGFIKHIKQDFILVNFFNNISAFIPKKFISTQPVEDVREVFHIGQIVKCTILKINPEEKKLIGSFITDPFDESTRSQKKNLKRKHENNSKSNVNIGSIEPQRKKKKLREPEVSENVQSSHANEGQNINKSRNSNNASEESDAIETDIHEEKEQRGIKVRQPPDEDLKLLDLSNCMTQKNYKKRVVSLLKAMNKRNQRVAAIDEEICGIEEEGLTVGNKRNHSALHAEKMLLEERLKLLMETLHVAQQKFNEFPPLEPVDYKRKKTKHVESNETEVNDEVKVKKKKKETKNEPDLSEVLKIKSKEIKVAEETTPVVEVPSAKDFWSLNLDTGLNNFNDKEDSDSSDEEVNDQTKKKRKKLTAAEKVAKARAEEEKLRELEKRAIEGDARPRSVDQFERALLADPNSSELWIAYMAFHLQATEIEKARTVGRKALKTISFREEQEKLNVWLAMLNFENRFGTKESQQHTLEEALQMNDTFKIHSKLLDIYVETSKIPELTALVDLMLRKYKRDPNTYVLAGNACYKLGLIDKARAVMQKAITVLDKKEHVSVIVQFGLSERAHGSPERSEALFEQILGVYPQRVDVCAVYVDALFKSNDVDNIRQVMERMTSLNLPAKKMKTLYKKWIEIEEKVGDAEQIEKIRQKAVEFIEKAQF